MLHLLKAADGDKMQVNRAVYKIKYKYKSNKDREPADHMAASIVAPAFVGEAEIYDGTKQTSFISFLVNTVWSFAY